MRASRRLRSVITGALATSALVAGSLAVAAAPASAETWSGYGSGPVGVTQTINVQNGCVSADPVNLTVTYANGTQYSSPNSWADASGNATILWTPPVAGTVTSAQLFNPSCGPGAQLGSAVISPAQTTTIVATPDTAKIGTATKVMVTVQSQSPSSTFPNGQVVVKDVNGATLQTMGLTNANVGSGQSYAYWWWTPQTAGTYTFKAYFAGDSNTASSTSQLDTTIATASGNAISLTVPGQLTAGVPTNLVATVGIPGVQGSVGFTNNGQPISGSVPMTNGVASFTWTPPAAGTITLGANFMTNQGGSGSTSQQVTVVNGPASQDVITLTQPGWGAWAPNGTYTLGNGTTFTFQASTLSGAPVTLSDTGPCNLSGNTLTVDVGSGQCNLIATSPGANGYAGVKYGYTINAVPGTQTATLSIPNSGRVQLKKTYLLETAGQGDTNAGQNIVWSIKKSSKSICKLGFPADGSVTIKLVKKGQCTVYGKAPGVPGQWNPYSITRTYRA